MIVGLDFLADEESFEPSYLDIGNIYRINMQDAIYDEIEIRENTDIIFDTNKSQWTYDFILLCPFQDDLNAGNVDFAGLTIANLIIKRKKSDEFEWQNLKTIPYDVNIIDYEFYDKIVEAEQEYDYTVLPVTDGGEEGNYINKQSITPQFDGVFLLDKNNIFKLLLNLEYNTTERVSPNEVFSPIGSKYPIIVANGDINYEQGSLRALVISDSTFNNVGNSIDKHQEKLNRKKLVDFLVNHKPKLLKDGNSNTWIVSILGTPTIDYVNELNQALANISFNWVEIADYNDIDDLVANGLL